MQARLLPLPLRPALTLALCLALAAPLRAESLKDANLDPAVPGRPGPVARAFLAQELFFHGLATGDALALIQSARMQARIGIIDTPERLPQDRGRKLKADAPAPLPPPQPDMTLKVAEALAKGDALLLELIDQTRAEPAAPRGAVRRSAAALAPGGAQVWTLVFFGGAPAELAVLGNGQSSLSIALSDETGHEPCATLAAADRLYCRFTSRQNGTFTLTVENPGPGIEAYWLVTN